MAILDAWQYHIFEGVDVLVVTHGCTVLSSEHKRVGLFDLDAVARLRMPEGYKASINAWRQQLSL